MTRIPTSFLVCVSVLASACSRNEAPAPAPEAPAAPKADTEALVRSALGGDWEATYFEAETDLNGDGANEIVAYVTGPMVCGTGGCPLYVFSPGPDMYTEIANISIVQTPVRVSSRSSNGWRNLIVHVAGGGIEPFDAELSFDGGTYPGNPSVPPAVPAIDLDGAEILIDDFDDYRDGKRLPVQ